MAELGLEAGSLALRLASLALGCSAPQRWVLLQSCLMASDGVGLEVGFPFGMGASTVGVGPGYESTFKGLKAADSAMPTSS